MADAVAQAKFIDLSDDELKDAVGSLHEYVKRLCEARKADQEIADLRQQAKDLDTERYTSDIKAANRRLTAARRVAEARGIKFDMPVMGEDE